MENVVFNNDMVVTIGDLNLYQNVSGHDWATFMNDKSTPLSLPVWKDIVKDYPVDVIYDEITQEIYDAVFNGDPEYIERIENDGYWMCGDYYHGGLVIFNTNSPDTVGWLLVRNMEACPDGDYLYWFYFGYNNEVITDEIGDRYICFIDQIKINGNFSYNTWGVIRGHLEIGKWNWQDNRIDYVTNTIPMLIPQVSVTGDDFVNNLPIFYATTFMRDCFTRFGPDGIPYHDRYPWWGSAGQIPPDPNAGGGGSSTGGGDGSFDNTSDSVPIPELPPDLLLSSGIIKMYYPTAAEMSAFTNYIYSSPTSVVDNFKKIWANPMDSIISLGTVPFNVAVNAHEEVKFCGVPSGISMAPIQSQYIQIDCGWKKLDKYWDGALDYNNYTKIKLFLPFIGFVDLNTDDANGATITVKYNIDLYTGDALAFVHIAKTDYPVKAPEDEKNKQAVNIDGTMYIHKGNVLSQVPLTGANYQSLYSGIMNLATGAITGGIPGAVAGIGAEVLSQKVDVQRSGHLSPNAGELGEYTPYLVIERPIQSLATDFVAKFGYPSNVYKSVKNLEGMGFVQIEPDCLKSKDLPNVTDEEFKELKKILEEGFII